jgi:hypothetical protein
VRDVVSEFTRLGARIPEETITALRICVGRALRDSALWARRYQFTLDQGAKSDVLRHRLPKVMVRGQPTSTTRDDPAWESEASTEPFHRER